MTIRWTIRARRGAVLAVLAVTLLGTSACGVVAGGSGLRSGAPAVSDAVVAAIPLGEYGTDVAVRADGARIYVPSRTGRIFAIDAASRQLAGTIMADGQPYAIALASDGARGWVMDLTAQYVLALDTRHDEVAKRISVGTIARAVMAPSVAVSRDGARAFVTNATATDDHLLVIDAATNTIVADHFLPIHPSGVAVGPDGRRVYVAGCALACIDGTLLVLDAASGEVISRVALASAATGLVLAPDGTRAYVLNGRAATVTAVDLATGSASTIPVGPQPTGAALDPRGARLYVTNFGASTISVVDTRASAVVATLGVARGPRAIAVSPDGRFAYVTHTAPTCSVLDLGRVAAGTAVSPTGP